MGHFEHGKWVTEATWADRKGRFVRSQTSFRDWVKADGSPKFSPEKDRYHLYISWACPWACRTAVIRKLKKLENIIPLSVVDYLMGEDGWAFSNREGTIPDTLNHAKLLRELYLKAKSDYTGRVTVPVLWDKKHQTIVNNESLEVMRMLDTEFDAFADPSVTFYPESLRPKIDETIQKIYQPINNGVYRAGFATSQEAYEEAVTELFDALDHWESVLANQRYLCGDVLTEADWCMFTTLIRFDMVYVGHFKCNVRRIVDYPNLWNYLKELYQTPGVAETCNFTHMKHHYYNSHRSVNPSGVVPKGPMINFTEPHNRK